MRPKHPIIEVAIEQIVLAEWNPKDPGEPEKIARLYKSIQRDGSYGVPAVRKLADGTYECIDGNHRVAALREEGTIKKVRVENFGEISKADAVLIGHRRNAQWFEEDQVRFGKLLAEALAENPDLDIVDFMPETEDEIDNIIKLAGFDFEPFSPPQRDDTGEGGTKIVIQADQETVDKWLSWCGRYKDKTGNSEPSEALLAALEIALESGFV